MAAAWVVSLVAAQEPARPVAPATANGPAAATPTTADAAAELQVPMREAPKLDGDLGDWAGAPILRLAGPPESAGAAGWSGPDDAALDLHLAYDTNHLFLAGTVHDDVVRAQPDNPGADAADGIELFLGAADEGDGARRTDAALRTDDLRLVLLPLHELRPWSVLDNALGVPRQGSWSLTGFGVAARAVPGGYTFEAAIPFHQLPALRPGARTLGFAIVLHDRDGDRDGDRDAEPTLLSWRGGDGADGRLGRLRFLGDGPLVGEPPPAHLIDADLLGDLPFLIVPLLAVALVLLLLRAWPVLQRRMRWLRPALFAAGGLLFAAGLVLPSVWLGLRDSRQLRQLDDSLATVRNLVDKAEHGTLASYRGASRDRALMDLLGGKAIARQRYTSYRFLSELAGADFGAGVCEFPGEQFAVRPYWVPLERGRAERFHFDPPLRGEELLVVVGRPATLSVPPFGGRPRAEVRADLGLGTGRSSTDRLVFDREFAPAAALGQELREVDWSTVPLAGELRTLSLTAEDGSDLYLVGVSLVSRRGEPAVPLFLGTASLDGVLTDLRGPSPANAGIELGPGASAKVVIPPERSEPCQKLWLFYRATYPGLPTANPGATVGEVTIRFRGDVPPRVLTLEHQVSMFYELVVHNTRDQPPEGSPAAIALTWVDASKEKHVNTVLPVLDLPPGAEVESIEFVNRADYRMRFRSVVFGSEKAAAPQDPDDSPLVRDGQDRRLRDDVRRMLAPATIAIYRERQLSESTLPPEHQHELQSLPRDLASAATAGRPRLLTTPGGARLAAVGVPLTGDGWDGAVLAVIVGDDEWQAAGELANRIALVLALCGAPLLLVLLSEILAGVANLRVRLMTVLSAASLAPLALLSVVLANVLERGHESDQQEGMRQHVRSAMGQLDDQMQRLRSSAQQWLQDLAQLHGARVGAVEGDKLEARLQQVLPALQQLLHGQLPPEWRGGFLKLEWNPVADHGSEPKPLLAGDARLAAAEAPARLEPGVYVHGGTVVIAVRSETGVRGGTLALTVGRPLNADFLGALAPGQSLLLCDPRGYPLECAGNRIPAKLLVAHGREPAVMELRERALFEALDQRVPIVERTASAYGEWLCGHEVLRDLQGTPRALLVLAQQDQRATLDLPIGRIPVRAFFFLVAGLLVVLSVFLSFVVSGRISRPVEQLERGTQSIAGGELSARVPVEDRGQLGRLSAAFNQMAAGLEGRLLDLQKLNRAMRELSTNLDGAHTIAVLRRFCEQHAAVDRVRIVLFDAETGQLELHGGADVERLPVPPELQFLPRAEGPFCLCWPKPEDASALAAGLPGIHGAIGLPLLAGGRCRGAVLLLFESPQPPPLELDLLATVTAQAAVALDNAELYRHAVQDPVTGAFVPDYFRRRTAEEVALAQRRGVPAALLGLGLGDGAMRPRGLRRFAAVLREQAPRGALLCHAGAGQFQLLAVGMDGPAAEALVGRVLEAWQRVVASAPESDVEDRPPTMALVVFPDEAASAEFLFDVLRDRLASGSAMAPAAVEVDASLRRAGIVAQSPAMREVYRTLRRVAPTDLGVLFLGETGTGKEVLTNLVHRWSKRANGPLVKVHCAALTETLLASELFGHEKGAFTGADRRKIGKFEQANGGTIFLDELGEIPLDMQVKLLRVLQEREVDRVGGVDPVAIDVRIVAATNRDLPRMVREGRFREDLFYRLQGIVVHVPPLRDRKQEIPALVEQFRTEVVASGQSRVRGFTTDAMDELFRRDWPGNIRELRNAVYRAMVLAAGDTVELRDVLAALPVLEAVPAGPGTAAAPGSIVAGAAAASGSVAGAGAVSAAPAGGTGAAAAGSIPPAVATPASSGPAPTWSATPGEPTLPALPALPRDAVVDEPQPATAGFDEFVLPHPERPEQPERTGPSSPTALAPQEVLAALPPRVRKLHARLVAAGSLGTQDHMDAAGVSHRTGLRDLQLLVELGLAERVGSRRGTRYRPSQSAKRLAD